MLRSGDVRRGTVPLLAFGLVLAACGASSGPSDGVASLEDVATNTTVAAEAAAEIDTEQALLDFAACMRERGVEIEDPTVDADGNVQFGRIGGGQGPESGEAIDREAMRAAREECGALLEKVTLGFRRADDAEFQDTLYEYAQCMRDNGVDMDDPDFSNSGPGGGGEPGEGGGGPFGSIDRDDPDFEAAQAACSDVLAGFGPGPGGARPGGLGAPGDGG